MFLEDLLWNINAPQIKSKGEISTVSVGNILAIYLKFLLHVSHQVCLEVTPKYIYLSDKSSNLGIT